MWGTRGIGGGGNPVRLAEQHMGCGPGGNSTRCRPHLSVGCTGPLLGLMRDGLISQSDTPPLPPPPTTTTTESFY